MIPIYYINLENASGRDKAMKYALNQFGLPNERINAVNMACIKRENYSKGEVNGMSYVIKQNRFYNPKAKEIAVMLSHLKALQAFVASENESDIAIILEDDMSFQYVDNWQKVIDDIVESAPADWNIIKLHSSSNTRIRKNVNLWRKGVLYDRLGDTELQSAGAYVIQRSAAKTLLAKYCIDGIYRFPAQNEYAVCECIIFSIPNVFMYTLPLLCAVENNITCNGNRNIADIQSNALIHAFWNATAL